MVGFTPLDLRRALLHEIVPDAQQFEQLASFWRQLGMTPSANPDQCAGPSVVSLPFLLATTVSADALVSAWSDILNNRHAPTLADLILIEYWFSAGAAQCVSVLNRRMSYSKTLLTVRQRVAIALHDYAREINWRRPVLFVSALKIARAYLRDAVGHESALRADLRKEFTGRLGVATVLISRFEKVSKEDADEARVVIQRSIDQGNNNGSAVAYLLEATCVAYDLEPDVGMLDRALVDAEAFGSRTPQESSITLAHIDLLLRKATAGGFSNLEVGALERAHELATMSTPVLAEDRARLLMAKAILLFLMSGESYSADMSHARLPFGLRTDVDPNQLLIRSAKFALEPLRSLAASGEPLARGLLADYLLVAASHLGIPEQEALAEVVSLRGGERGLEDERSQLLHCRDQLRLASVSRNKNSRIDTLLRLAQMLSADPTPTAPLVMLARDVESHGAQPMPIEAGTDDFVAEVLRDVSQGRVAELFEKAGSAALASPDLSVLALGGRSGVTTVADYYGLSGETFVFKQMSAIAIEQERQRAEAISEFLAAEGLSERYAVSRPLAIYRTNSTRSEVTAARHYVRGRSLFEVLQVEVDDRVTPLASAARFLGAINRCEIGPPENEGRRDVKSKEFGRWLRVCGLSDVNSVFDQWWDILRGSELVRRRDAHLHNWLLSEDTTLCAIDLEAQGWRPAGYDLAQITDDHAFLDADDWESRRVIFEAYRDGRGALSDTEEVEWVTYQAAVLSRLVWGLTGTVDSPFESGVAENRLDLFARSVDEPRLRALAEQILEGWLSQRGLSQLPVDNGAARGAGRIRTSKSMAYHLRHDEALERDEGGWSSLEDLREVLSPKLGVEVLAAAATDKNEQRFEIREGRIRAKYGHSVPIAVDYDPPRSELRLYHASPWALATRVVDSKDGIRPMGRQFVHLTDSVEEAVANGMRAGQPLLYSVSSAHVPSVLLAHGHTYLSKAIPLSWLSIVPVSCFWTHIPPCA